MVIGQQADVLVIDRYHVIVIEFENELAFYSALNTSELWTCPDRHLMESLSREL